MTCEQRMKQKRINSIVLFPLGQVNVEFNNTNHTVEVGEEISIPSNDTHVVYTVSDSPSCWMYVFFNVTQWNNETIRNWFLYPGKFSSPPRGKGIQPGGTRLKF